MTKNTLHILLLNGTLFLFKESSSLGWNKISSQELHTNLILVSHDNLSVLWKEAPNIPHLTISFVLRCMSLSTGTQSYISIFKRYCQEILLNVLQPCVWWNKVRLDYFRHSVVSLLDSLKGAVIPWSHLHYKKYFISCDTVKLTYV